MRGGRIKGQGTYGCVFQPALECRGKEKGKVNPGMVGKITSKSDAKNELDIARHLNKIPNVEKYVITVQGEPCVPRAKSRQTDKDVDQCKTSEKVPLETMVQLSMPWGGYPINHINLDPHVFDFIHFTRELLAIGSFILLNDVCHFDLSALNMLFDNKLNPRLIDFGFSFRPSKLTIEEVGSRWREIEFSHDTETPEVTLIIMTHDNFPIEHIIHGLQKEKPAVLRLASMCDVSPTEWSAELRQWAMESQSFQRHDWLQCWKLYWPGFDAWSIGAILLHILEIQMSIPGFKEMPSWKAHGPLVKSILKGLCRGHPAYRIDAAEALSLLTGGAHPLISSGSPGNDWIQTKKARRPHA